MKEAELVKKVEELQQKIAQAQEIIGLPAMMTEAADLEAKTMQPDFWQDQDMAKQVSQRLADLQKDITAWQQLADDAAALAEIVGADAADQSVDVRTEAEQQYAQLLKQYEQLEFAVLFAGQYDKDSALVAIHAGAGGDDAQDWAEMLLRMVLRFCEQKGFTTTILDQSSGTQAGIKSVVIEVTGRYAYGWLQSEHGVHRLVRISPFDAEKMRHTSFAFIEVIPELGDVGSVEIQDEDLRIDVFRAGGHGGQSVNTTDSAVRIVHTPTGITVTCQNERSQHQNKAKAMQILQSRLQQYVEAEQEEERQRLRGQLTEAAWGNQVRSYVLHPYKMVKDHRTDYQTSDVDGVLDGDLEPFIEAFLRQQAEHNKN